MVKLEDLFPGLAAAGYRITSPRSTDYNCIAWAAGQTGTWWWPGPDLVKEYWPSGHPRELTLSAFQGVFAGLGYSICRVEDPESGVEKIALFADADGRPTHAARQLPNGLWTSKLGKAEDIEHTLRAVEGDIYGSVVLIMQRPLVSASAAPAPEKAPPDGLDS
jgi:hypothetical protein